jgi:hypothetical protein
MNIKCQVSDSEQELLTILTHVYIHMGILVLAIQLLTLEHTVHYIDQQHGDLACSIHETFKCEQADIDEHKPVWSGEQ